MTELFGDRASETNGRIKVAPATLIQIAVWAVSLALGYAAITNRLSVVETKQSDSERRLYSIEQKIDVLLAR